MTSTKVLLALMEAWLSFASPALPQSMLSAGASPDVRKELAPTAKIRAAINVSNIVLAQKDPAGGEPRGITVDLARELAKRVDLPLELVVFESAGRVTDALKSGAWDIA